MTYYILGLADKRPVVYPLLYVLSLSGSVLFISDDGAYRRLLTEYTNKGNIGNVLVYTNHTINGEVLKRDGVNPGDYDHVVYALMDGVFEKDGLNIYTQQDASPFRQAHPLDDTEQIENFQTVRIGFEAPSEKGAFFIPISEPLLRELHKVENHCRLSPPKNAKAVAVLSALFAPAFGKTEKEMRKYLCYKGGILT